MGWLQVPKLSRQPNAQRIQLISTIRSEFNNEWFYFGNLVGSGKLLASEQSRVQRRGIYDSFGVDLKKQPSFREILVAKKRMESKPFLVETFINDQFFLLALFDSGCLQYAAFSKNIVMKHKLPRISVEQRNLQLAKNDKPYHKINQITHVTLDIHGWCERLWV